MYDCILSLHSSFPMHCIIDVLFIRRCNPQELFRLYFNIHASLQFLLAALLLSYIELIVQVVILEYRLSAPAY